MVGATRLSLVFYVSPVVATLGGWLLFGESLSAMTAVGTVDMTVDSSCSIGVGASSMGTDRWGETGAYFPAGTPHSCCS